MPRRFLDLVVTPAVARAQQRTYGASHEKGTETAAEPLGPDEAEFIAARDSFYLASVSETGWPYVQHRGGPAGFLRVLDARTLAFADVRGNRQLVTAGNVAGDGRVALLLMDYPNRQRLKILGRAAFIDAAADPALLATLASSATRGRVERLVRIAVEAWDWNCPQHITPRYTLAEVEALAAPLRERIAELERRLGERTGP
jgi:predicted pyridoxine 5'-phosphate oxidase superfamily flavin-nucleotide-binding protein